MPESRRPAPVLLFTGQPGDALLARQLRRALGRQVVVPAGPDGLLDALRGRDRPLAAVVGEPVDPPLPGGILRAVNGVAGRVPVIYLGGEEPADEMAARRAGVHYVAQRPVNLDELEAVIAALADRRPRVAGSRA